MKNHQLNEEPVDEQNGSMIAEYKTFKEFENYSNKQVQEIDQFLKSYAELIYHCFSKHEKEEGKVITMEQNQNNLKAA